MLHAPLRREKIRRGVLKVETEPLFPRYLFIQLDTALTSQSWTPVRSTKGVSRLVTFGSHPARVSDSIVALLRSMESNSQGTTQRAIQRIFTPGDRVQLTEGAFAGIEGIYQTANGTARAMVLIELLSKPDQNHHIAESRRRGKVRSPRERTPTANHTNAHADRDTVGR
jgi:transcriptional antiterminator RfaH